MRCLAVPTNSHYFVSTLTSSRFHNQTALRARTSDEFSFSFVNKFVEITDCRHTGMDLLGWRSSQVKMPNACIWKKMQTGGLTQGWNSIKTKKLFYGHRQFSFNEPSHIICTQHVWLFQALQSCSRDVCNESFIGRCGKLFTFEYRHCGTLTPTQQLPGGFSISDSHRYGLTIIVWIKGDVRWC